MIGEIKKKRGRRSKNSRSEYVLNKSRTKFMVHMNKENKSLEMVFKLLRVANKKDFGKEITFKELALYSMAKLKQKDIVRLQKNSMSEMEKVTRVLDDYNLKSGMELTLGEFLVKQLNIKGIRHD